MTEAIGFIGLGNVGKPAAGNLVAAGYRVVGYDIRRNDAAIAAGVEWAETLDGLRDCAIILQSLPNSAALAATVDALLPQLGRGRIVADISSYPLDDKRAAADRIAVTGAVMLDCEVSGLPMQVANRTAVLFCAGDEQAIERCAPVFGTFTARQFNLGGFGAATRMKLIANAMVCAHNLIAAEALNLGRAAGLDPAKMVEVLTPSAAGSTTFANKAPLMVSRQFEAGHGPFRHMFGYLARAAQLAADSGVGEGTPVLDSVRRTYDRAEAEGRHDQDIAAIIEVIEEMGGRCDAG